MSECPYISPAPDRKGYHTCSATEGGTGRTKIPWADECWNVIESCSEVSAGCRNCYARRMAPRLGVKWGAPIFRPDRLEQPLHWRKPRTIFVCSRADVFHEKACRHWQTQIINVMRKCPQHTFLLLTKRPQVAIGLLTCTRYRLPSNAWLGVSVEDQGTADARIPILLDTPAAHRWVSVEPMLGPVAIGRYFVNPKRRIEQVVAGCESGPTRRPASHAWFVYLSRQCRLKGIPYYLKQRSVGAEGDGKVLHLDPQPSQLAWNPRGG